MATELSYKESKQALLKLDNNWQIKKCRSIEKEYKFENFQEVIQFANKIFNLAEQFNHHPELSISYDKVIVTLCTHGVMGLSEKDFFLAAEIEKMPH